ncbi:hypothetical protein TNCV_3008891 [Trichonephila clavipes]|nr:hypothetical protein TNCV_3008891 [Trichonephila clavipes]
MSLASVRRHLPPSRDLVVSRETIRRRLVDAGATSRQLFKRLPLIQITNSMDWVFDDLEQAEAYSDYRSRNWVGRLLGHTITSSRPSTYFDGTQLRGLDLGAHCTACTIKSPRCHFSARPHSSTYINSPNNVSKDLSHSSGLPGHLTRRQ